MRINKRTELGLLFTLIIGLLLVIITLFSLIVLIEYYSEESASLPIQMALCLPLSFIMLIFITIYNILNAHMINMVSESSQSTRAFYILLFYPIILLSYMMATLEYGFQTSLIYGFPFYLIGVILLPYGAFVIHREAKMVVNKNMVLIYCQNCNYTFEMHRLDTERRCPFCGVLNQNINVENDKE